MMNSRRSDLAPIQLVLMVLARQLVTNHQLEILRQRSFVYEFGVLFRMVPMVLAVGEQSLRQRSFVYTVPAWLKGARIHTVAFFDSSDTTSSVTASVRVQ